MKVKTFKDYYQLGDLVEDEHGRAAIVISVTRKRLIIKLEYGTATYTEAKDLDTFKNEVTVLMRIGSLLKIATNINV